MKCEVMRIKRFSLLLFVILLVGCHNSGTQNGSAGKEEVPPGPKVEPQWGDLNCQNSRTCQDPVLNKRWVDLINFFKLNFERPLPKGDHDSPDLLIYRCGIRTQKQWVDTFHVPPGSSEENAIAESHFFDDVLEFESCTYKDSLDDRLKAYFKNTKEYKDENK